MPADVERMMTEGVVVDTIGEDSFFAQELSQYAFTDNEHFVRGSQECDRALLAGHLEILCSVSRWHLWALLNVRHWKDFSGADVGNVF